ncbi:dihydroorotate dehydrogenase (quinone), partial [Rhizobium brockwellii]
DIDADHAGEAAPAHVGDHVLDAGKNLTTPVERAVDDYLACLTRAHEHAHYISINISSPNTPGLRNLQFGEHLDGLL